MFSMDEVADASNEAWAQDDKWGDQSHLEDGTGKTAEPLLEINLLAQVQVGHMTAEHLADIATQVTKANAAEGKCTWAHILTEEFFEALAESDEDKLLEELNQVATVALQWRAAIRRRNARKAEQ